MSGDARRAAMGLDAVIGRRRHALRWTMECHRSAGDLRSAREQEAIPAVEDYPRLRRISGLTARSAEAARAGLPGSYLAVCVVHGRETIAMGRIMSDGAPFFHLVDREPFRF